MTNFHSQAVRAERLQALEARFAWRLASRLNEAERQLPHDITERLRFAREQALSRARTVQAAPVAAPAVVGAAGGAALLAGPPPIWLRLVSLMPLVVLVAGLVFIQQHHDREQINAAAEVDAALLADELPPAAYRDPGFAAFLQAQDAQ